MILLVVNLVLGLIFAALPHALSNGLSSIISGTIVSPFIALVVTLVYYRLSGDVPDAAGPGRELRRVRADAVTEASGNGERPA